MINHTLHCLFRRLSSGVITLALTAVILHNANAKLRVVTTLPALGALVSEVGGDRVDTTVLVNPADDPHYLDPRPNIVLTLSSADMVVLNGMELEVGWLPKLLVSARNPNIQVGASGYVDASTVVHKLEVGAGGVDRRGGDIHVSGNPHYLYDPRNGVKVVVLLAQRLTAADPEGAAVYAENARRLSGTLTVFAANQIRRFLALEQHKRRVVTYHRSLVYLTDWLQLNLVGTIEPKPGIAPDPGHVAFILSAMKTQQCKTILQERYYPAATANTLAKLTGATVVLFYGGPDISTQRTYQQHLEELANKLFETLNAL